VVKENSVQDRPAKVPKSRLSGKGCGFMNSQDVEAEAAIVKEVHGSSLVKWIPPKIRRGSQLGTEAGRVPCRFAGRCVVRAFRLQ